MTIHPNTIIGRSVAIFIWDESGACGGSAVLFGSAAFEDGEFFVIRTSEPIRMPIPDSAWHTLRHNPTPEVGTTFETAEFVVTLRLGPLPPEAAGDAYQEVDIPILKN
jgi:hypothetical protein